MVNYNTENRTLQNKLKVINDPVYGFITIPNELLFDLIEHPWFQRLRRIKQLGLTHLVYPGAMHTRFLHALGAMHLMTHAVHNLRSKNIVISEEEANALYIAILLHDIGHSPFSHALEKSLFPHLKHETISFLLMEKLNLEFDNKLDLAIKIFKNEYNRPFFHQLVSSQIDMDRLDYLNRDSFFTGVSEGIIGWDRIIKVMNVVDEQLVMEEKGISSIEKFLFSRSVMYWQVYMHKTVLSSEFLLINLLKRAKDLCLKNKLEDSTKELEWFMQNGDKIKENDSNLMNQALDYFVKLDDFDIVSNAKSWSNSEDKILSKLAQDMLNRNVYKLVLTDNEMDENIFKDKCNQIKTRLDIESEEVCFFVNKGDVSNLVYTKNDQKIKLLLKNGEVVDFVNYNGHFNQLGANPKIKKYYFYETR